MRSVRCEERSWNQSQITSSPLPECSVKEFLIIAAEITCIHQRAREIYWKYNKIKCMSEEEISTKICVLCTVYWWLQDCRLYAECGRVEIVNLHMAKNSRVSYPSPRNVMLPSIFDLSKYKANFRLNSILQWFDRSKATKQTIKDRRKMSIYSRVLISSSCEQNNPFHERVNLCCRASHLHTCRREEASHQCRYVIGE